MSDHDHAIVPGRIAPEMFTGPGRLRPFMPLLRRLPAPIVTELFAGIAVIDGVVRISPLRRTLRWAAAHSTSRAAAWRLAVALLANHGRSSAEHALVGLKDTGELGRNLIIEGAQHLNAIKGAAILIGFHLGPPHTALALRTRGYAVRFASRLEAARDNDQWDDALQAGEAVRLPPGPPQQRGEALHRMRNLLREGALVYIAADGGLGREAFRLDDPGGAIVVRMGWLALRRLTRVPTLPVLTYREGRRRVIVIHPPLPEPDEDSTRDATTCRAILAPLVEDYVRRFPSQCRYAALRPLESKR